MTVELNTHFQAAVKDLPTTKLIALYNCYVDLTRELWNTNRSLARDHADAAALMSVEIRKRTEADQAKEEHP
jgi:hypothetical protein